MASNGSRVQVWKVLRDDDHFYGLGEKTGPLDKRGAKLGGTALVMWNSDVYGDRKSTRLNSSHSQISYAVFCLKKKKKGTQCAEDKTEEYIAVTSGRAFYSKNELFEDDRPHTLKNWLTKHDDPSDGESSHTLLC